MRTQLVRKQAEMAAETCPDPASDPDAFWPPHPLPDGPCHQRREPTTQGNRDLGVARHDHLTLAPVHPRTITRAASSAVHISLAGRRSCRSGLCTPSLSTWAISLSTKPGWMALDVAPVPFSSAREVLGDGAHRRLARAVSPTLGQRDERRHTAQQTKAALALHHVGQGHAHGVQQPEHVDLELPAPGIIGQSAMSP